MCARLATRPAGAAGTARTRRPKRAQQAAAPLSVVWRSCSACGAHTRRERLTPGDWCARATRDTPRRLDLVVPGGRMLGQQPSRRAPLAAPGGYSPALAPPRRIARRDSHARARPSTWTAPRAVGPTYGLYTFRSANTLRPRARAQACREGRRHQRALTTRAARALAVPPRVRARMQYSKRERGATVHTVWRTPPRALRSCW